MPDLDAGSCKYAHYRTQSVKLARTIADPAGSEEIQAVPVVEVLHLRPPKVDAELMRQQK